MTGKEFFKICEEEFSYLKKEYNFEIDEKNIFEWGFEIRIKNSTTGVILNFEQRDFFVFLKICKLQNGEFVLNRGELRPNTLINNFDIEDLLSIRNPKAIFPKYNNNTILNDDLIKKLVKHHANNLREYSIDILMGNFSIFSELDKIVKERAKEFAIKKWGKDAMKFGWEVN